MTYTVFFRAKHDCRYCDLARSSGERWPMTEWRCGKPTKDGRPCGWHTPPCPHHPEGDDSKHSTEAAPGVERPARDSAGLALAIVQHDLHRVAWSLLGEAVAEEDRNASLISTLIRVLASLGPAQDDEDGVLREVVLRGRLMTGMPPATEDQWARAEQVFDDAALTELRRWEREVANLLKNDGRDIDQPQ